MPLVWFFVTTVKWFLSCIVFKACPWSPIHTNIPTQLTVCVFLWVVYLCSKASLDLWTRRESSSSVIEEWRQVGLVFISQVERLCCFHIFNISRWGYKTEWPVSAVCLVTWWSGVKGYCPTYPSHPWTLHHPGFSTRIWNIIQVWNIYAVPLLDLESSKMKMWNENFTQTIFYCSVLHEF